MSKLIRPGRLEVITGPMFSGKTSELLRRIRRARHAGHEIQIYVPFIDNRYCAGYLNTHDKVQEEKACSVSDTDDLVAKLDKNMDGYAFDEIQFLDGGILSVIEELRRDGKFVIVAALNMDYLGRPFRFKGSKRDIGDLLVVADDIAYLTAICQYPVDGKKCKNPATRTQRIVESDELVLVGGKDFYEARCPEHHFV
jgi:thymidine kinase